MQNLSSKKNNIIINTLAQHDQGCLIQNTLNIEDEVSVLNDYMKKIKVLE